ncbi:MAG: arginine--tRNA ligase [Gammaproteobacteria bacterium]|nr:arginine--tRNA ligase [Gammaproteobacteria bacterium]
MNIRNFLDNQVSQALQAAGAKPGTSAIVKQSSRPEFGHYQANGVIGAAKQLKTNPREFAAKVIDNLDLSGIAETVEIAGPGFINIHLSQTWLSSLASEALNSESLNIDKTDKPDTVVIDYSSPNLAKEMHVGHLRSTIIGDAIARILEFTGHTVIRQNHVGDWGTQFGMLLTHMQDIEQDDQSLTMQLADLEQFYQAAKQRFDSDADFAQTARDNVVRLQSGDPEYLKLWQQFIDISLQHCEDIYHHLNVLLTRNDVMPESAYNNDLSSVVEDLNTHGLLSEDQGAQCVFLDEFKGKDGKIIPMIVQKSDGGYLYATTDLAALRYRHKTLDMTRGLYVIDARQSLHMKQVFAVGKHAGFVPQSTQLEHIAFGTMMGDDGTPFKTRSGGTVKLADLLDEARQRAFDLVTLKNPDLDEQNRRDIANSVGIGAVKYADLSKNRTSDYIFNWDTMLSFEGNTAPYLQYAYARIQSIFRKAGNLSQNHAIELNEAAEIQLTLKLLQFSEAIDSAAKDSAPNLLCNYLYELAGQFMHFYESCPILSATDAIKNSRLQLANLTANTIRTGLDLLGIAVLDRM